MILPPSCFFGESLNSLGPESPPENQEFLKGWHDAQECVSRRVLVLSWISLFVDDNAKYRYCCRVVHNFDDKVQKAIQYCASSQWGKHPKFSLAHEIVAKGMKNPIQIRVLLLHLLFPSHVAIVMIFTNIFFYLARQPSSWAKLQGEISTIGSEDLTRERIRRLNYLQGMIKEALPLHPGLATNVHTALHDTVLPTDGGRSGQAPIIVGRGDHVKISLYALRRRKDIWGEDADELRAECWAALTPSHREYLPFGGGPRLCPAYELGLAQVAYVIVKVLRYFKGIENYDPVARYVEENKIVSVSKNGTLVSLFPT